MRPERAAEYKPRRGEREPPAALPGGQRPPERGGDATSERQGERPAGGIAGRALDRIGERRGIGRPPGDDHGDLALGLPGADRDRRRLRSGGCDEHLERALEEPAVGAHRHGGVDVQGGGRGVRRPAAEDGAHDIGDADRLDARREAARIEPLGEQVVLDELPDPRDGAQAHGGELLAPGPAAVRRRQAGEELRGPERGRERVPDLVRHEAEVATPRLVRRRSRGVGRLVHHSNLDPLHRVCPLDSRSGPSQYGESAERASARGFSPISSVRWKELQPKNPIGTRAQTLPSHSYRPRPGSRPPTLADNRLY